MGGGPDPPTCLTQVDRSRSSNESILMEEGSSSELKEVENLAEDEERNKEGSVYSRLGGAAVTRGGSADDEAGGVNGGLEVPRGSGIDEDVAWYSCLLHQPCKFKKTEDLLKSKVQEGEEFVRVKYGNDVVGWDFLCLDDDAKTAVEACDAIRDLRPGGDLAKSCHDDPAKAIRALEVAERCCHGHGHGYKECTEEMLRGKVERANRLLQSVGPGHEVIERWDPALDEIIREELEWQYYQGPRMFLKGFCGAPTIQTLAVKEVKLYEVEAVDQSNIQETEDFLRSVVEKPDEMYRAMRESGKIWGWWWLSLTGEAKEKVEKHRGIKCVKHMKMVGEYDAAPEVSASTSGGPQHFNAMVKGWDADVKATEQFLKSKVGNPDEIKRHTWHHVVYGWWNLSLGVEAKREVEEHENIENVELMENVQWLKEPSSQDVKSYFALPREGADIEETEKFLRSQVRSSRCIYGTGRKKHGKVMGWTLMLDYTGLREICQYDGIREILCSSKVESF